VDTLAHSAETLLQGGLGERRVRQYEQGIQAFHKLWGTVEQFWVNAQDPTYFGVCFIAHSSERDRWQPRERDKWRCIASHMVTAFRIRRQLELDAARKTTEDGSPEAVLSPDGRLEHAERPAQGEAARAALQGAVLAMDRARGRLRKQDPERAVALWRALVAGRWSLLDHFDSDGRRFVVAHRNDARVPDNRGLSTREQQVLAHASIGQSNKAIAYELGLSVSTVATHLARARAKLKLPSRAALARRQ
jgi:DNA-binding CsgD family transcriptional regulator